MTGVNETDNKLIKSEKEGMAGVNEADNELIKSEKGRMAGVNEADNKLIKIVNDPLSQLSKDDRLRRNQLLRMAESMDLFIIELLKDIIAKDPSVTTNNINTACLLHRGVIHNILLSYGVVYDQPRYMRELVSMGADVNWKDVNGNTPLHVAVAYPDPEVLRTLLDLGADRNIKNNDGKIPLDVLNVEQKSLKKFHTSLLQNPERLKVDMALFKDSRDILRQRKRKR
jgi:ankyrin repeat protein